MRGLGLRGASGEPDKKGIKSTSLEVQSRYKHCNSSTNIVKLSGFKYLFPSHSLIMNGSNDDESDYSDTDSIDSCEEYINFKSIRVDGLEEAISFSWPGIYEEANKDGGDDGENDGEIKENKQLRKLVISTLLEEDDLAPLFDGSRWAGTRLWAAAVRAVQYINGRLQGTEDRLIQTKEKDKAISLLELGCGLGVPGMIFHLLGCNVVLTDQIEILSQLEKNVLDNFPNAEEEKDEAKQSIIAKPLSWSRTDVNSLLDDLGKSDTGFDIVVNCDCVYEPLYGKSWHLLNETIDELLKVNPQTLVVSSMERRAADGIDLFIEEMKNMEHVGSVEKAWSDDEKRIEIYITRGIS